MKYLTQYQAEQYECPVMTTGTEHRRYCKSVQCIAWREGPPHFKDGPYDKATNPVSFEPSGYCGLAGKP